MTIKDSMAPEKTCIRGWRIERIAAMRNVLSPISENIMIKKGCKSGCSDVGAHSGRERMGDVDMDDVEATELENCGVTYGKSPEGTLSSWPRHGD
jgi:hypothetical protein